MPKLIKIALPLPIDKLFSYWLPDSIESDNVIGSRVLVPFGKRTLTGVIISVSPETDIKDIKSIYEILDLKPAFSDIMLKFTKWIAEYYLGSWGEVLKAALPQGMSPHSVLKINIIKEISEEEIYNIKQRAPKRAALLRILMNHVSEVTVNYLARELRTDSIAAQLEALVNLGYITCERVTEKDIKPKFQKALSISPELLEDDEKLKSVFDELDKIAPKQALLFSHIYLIQTGENRPALMAEALKDTKTTAEAANGLIKKGYLIKSEIEVDRNRASYDGESLSKGDESKLELTPEQNFAKDKILISLSNLKVSNDKSPNPIIEQRLTNNEFTHSSIPSQEGKSNSEHRIPGDIKPILLHGITGSGKTLVYIHIIKHILSIGKSALLLVPEISLTPQLIDRFQRVFPDNISVLHSRMSEGERYDSWRAIKEGKAQIVIGARSALFAPLKALGLIIVDEEHEYTYKQDSGGVRYHARDSAIMRAKIEGAVVVLGSATPSIESMFNAHSGKYQLLKINQRADRAMLPDIKIIDTLQSRKKGLMKGNYSKDLLNDINTRLEKKEGVILLHNRRGFSSMLECLDCGFIPMCENCSVTLTYHKKFGQLRCHYCGYTINVYKSCPACGYPELKEIGTGTQRIEDELQDLLKNHAADTTKGLDTHILVPNSIESLDTQRLVSNSIEYSDTQILVSSDTQYSDTQILPSSDTQYSILNTQYTKLARMDLDTTSRKGSHRKILQDFASGRTDILVGTQMVAKGLDFERVTLVGVINADLQLFIPDFRASERTFQLLTQVAGRAGRSSDLKGEVIIQTSHPDNFAISSVLQGGYDSFYNEEIQNRREAFYPPFTRFISIEFSGKDEKKVEKQAQIFSSLISKHDSIIKLGPVKPYISRIRSQYRRIIILKNLKNKDASGKILRQIINKAKNEYNMGYSTSAVRFIIDIDSYSGM